MLVGNLISTIFNNIKQSTLLFSTHSVLQGPIGSDPPQLSHFTFPHSSLLQVTSSYNDLLKQNTYPWLRAFASDGFLSPEHGFPRYPSSRLHLSSLDTEAPMSSLWEDFPHHLYKIAAPPSFTFLHNIYLYFTNDICICLLIIFCLTRMKTPGKCGSCLLFFVVSSVATAVSSIQ